MVSLISHRCNMAFVGVIREAAHMGSQFFFI